MTAMAPSYLFLLSAHLSALLASGSSPQIAFVGRAATAFRRLPSLHSGVPADVGAVGGPVLRPPSSAECTSFDTACVANPVVLPPAVGSTDLWQMYYYGNPGCWANGTKGFLPTGYVGLAESTDGVNWERVAGSEEGGSVLAPTGQEDDWDGLQLGVGDVVHVGENELHMYYFGGSFESLSFGGPMPPAQGLRMRIGKARSTNKGRSWERMGQVLDYDPDEGVFASWPRIVLPQKGTSKPWRMSYHAFNGTRWAAFGAVSTDKGKTWSREGGIALGPGGPDSWDGSGVGTRAIARAADGALVMVYEAVEGGGGPFAGRHRFGLARWDETEEAWKKDTTISGVPGGPILDGGVKPMNPWTSHVIGTPFLVPMENGSMRLYFCSKKDNDMSMSIGLVESASGDFGPSSWRSISPN